MLLQGKSITLPRPRKIALKELRVATSKLKPTEIVAKTLFSAISQGTETAAYRGDPPLRPGIAYPRLVGYCNVAEVVQVGKFVKTIRPGDRVLTHQSHRSIFSIQEREVLARIPKKVPSEEAAVTYLYHLGLNALQTIPLKPELPVAVIGLGILGLGAVEQAKNLKLNVSAFSNSQYKLQLAKELGAKKVHLKRKSKKLENLANLVITTSNSWEDWRLALRLVRPRGTISVIGFPGRGLKAPNFNPLDPRFFYYKKISIVPVGVSSIGRTEEEMLSIRKKNCSKILRLMKLKRLNPRRLISGIYDYRDIKLAYEKILSKDSRTI